jgi:hypothetical protein
MERRVQKRKQKLMYGHPSRKKRIMSSFWKLMVLDPLKIVIFILFLRSMGTEIVVLCKKKFVQTVFCIPSQTNPCPACGQPWAALTAALGMVANRASLLQME